MVISSLGVVNVMSIRSALIWTYVLRNKRWFQLFLDSNQAFLDMISSVELFRGSFHFDRSFLHKPGVKDEIKKAWLTNHLLFETKVSDRLKRCRKALSR